MRVHNHLGSLIFCERESQVPDWESINRDAHTLKLITEGQSYSSCHIYIDKFSRLIFRPDSLSNSSKTAKNNCGDNLSLHPWRPWFSLQSSNVYDWLRCKFSGCSKCKFMTTHEKFKKLVSKVQVPDDTSVKSCATHWINLYFQADLYINKTMTFGKKLQHSGRRQTSFYD